MKTIIIIKGDLIMKPIQSSLKNWMKDNHNFQENYAKIKNEVLNNPEIKNLINQHPELNERTIEKNLIKLYEYVTQSKQCQQCESFAKCKNMLQGYSPILEVIKGDIHLSYEKCPNRLLHEKDQEQNNLIQSLYVPKEILQATIKNIDTEGKGRTDSISRIYQFLHYSRNELPKKGLYLSGPFGVGKTYLLGAVANELKNYNVSSMIIFMPEFVREIRSSLKDDSLNEKVDYFKKADVLMFDDIGAEKLSAWFRDEILGSILQYRMMEKLPVFFTSNYTLEQLETQLADTKDGIETVKAGRIIERIKQVSEEVVVGGENRRN